MTSKPLLLLVSLLVVCPALAQQKTTDRPMARTDQQVRIVGYNIQPSKRDQYERFVHEIFWPGVAKLSLKDQELFRQSRILHPTKANPDGSYTYMFIMDPFIEGADYSIVSQLDKMYGKEKAAEYYKLFTDAQMPNSKYIDYLMIQSKD